MTDKTVVVRVIGDVQNYRKGLQQAAEDTRNLAGTMSRSANQMKSDQQEVGRVAGVAALAIAAGLGLAERSVLGFDRQISELGAAVHGTRDELNDLRQAALDAGAATAFSASDAAQAETELAKAGVDVADILGGALRGSLDLAAAGSLDLGEAARIASETMTTFGLSGRDMSKVADAISAGANKSTADVGTLSQGLSQAGLVAHQYGLTMEETVGVLSLFSSNSLNGSDAGTSFKQMLLSLGAPTLQAKDLMADLGIQIYDSSGQMLPFADVADNLKGALSGMTEETRNSTLATLFGSDAIRAAAIVLQAGGEGIRQWTADVSEQGYASEVAGQKLDNLAGDVEALGGAIESALIEGGSKATPVLRGLTQGATDAVGGFSELPDWLQWVGLGLGGIATTGLGAVGMIGTFKPKVDDLKKALHGWGTAGQFVERHLGSMSALTVIAGGALTLYSMAVGKAAEKEREHQQAVDDLTQAMIEQGSAVGAVSNQAIGDKILGGDLGEKLRAAAVDLGVLTQGVVGHGEAVDGLDNLYDRLIQIFERHDLAQLAALTGTSVGDLNSELDILRHLLSESDLAGTPAADELVRLAEAGELTGGEISELLDRLGDIGSANSDAVTEFENLDESERQLAGTTEAVAEAQRHQQQVTQELTGDVKALADAIESSLEN